jgi:hypothetical protein
MKKGYNVDLAIMVNRGFNYDSKPKYDITTVDLALQRTNEFLERS